MPKTITRKEELLKNLLRLETYRYSSIAQEKLFYQKLIQKGLCFIVYQINKKYIFGPSKFLGYKDNDILAHQKNKREKTISGSETNMEIQKIFKHKFVSDPNMDRIFTDFCCLNSIKPDKKNRKFIFYDDLKNITPEEIQVQDILEITENKIITATQKEQQILSRIGQGEFRNQLISYWKGCALSGCSQIELLIASHIRPWAVSSNEERLDVFNGLLLLPNYDKLFDRGFISFDHDGSILISEQIKLADYHKLGLDYDLKIRLIINHQKYLTFHREQIFCSRL